MSGRAASARIDELAWQVQRRRLLDMRQRDGSVSRGAVRRVAEMLGCSERTVWRRLNQEKPKARRRLTLTDQYARVIKLHGGNVSLAWKDLHEAGLATFGYRTLLRAFNALPLARQRGLRDGLTAMRTAHPYLELAPPTRPNEILEIDHALLPDVTLYDPVNRRAGHPWITVIIDVYTRLIVGFSLTLAAKDGSATSESAFLALADALLGREVEDVRIGGLFEWIRYDQGADFMGPVAEALARLGVGLAPCEAYTPWTKPYIERFIRTLKEEVLPTLPGYGVSLDEAA